MNSEESNPALQLALPATIDTTDPMALLEVRLCLRLLRKLQTEGWPLVVEGDKVLLAPERNGVLVEDAYAASLVVAIQQLQNTEVETDLQDFRARLLTDQAMASPKKRSAEVRNKIAEGQKKAWEHRRTQGQTSASSETRSAASQEEGEASPAEQD